MKNDDLKTNSHIAETLAKIHVMNYYNDHFTDGHSSKLIEVSDVYVVWFCKTLHNFKMLLSTTVPDGMYYEVTCDVEKEETYLDVYKRIDHIVIPEYTINNRKQFMDRVSELARSMFVFKDADTRETFVNDIQRITDFFVNHAIATHSHYKINENTHVEAMEKWYGKPISDKFYPEKEDLSLPFSDLNLLEESGGSLATRDVLGYDLMIDQVQMKVPVAKTAEDSVDGKTFDASGFKVITVKGLKIKPDYRTRTFTGRVCQPSLIKGDDTVTEDTILGLIDFYSGKVSITCLLGLIQKVHFSGHLSCAKSEFKQHATASIETKKNQ